MDVQVCYLGDMRQHELWVKQKEKMKQINTTENDVVHYSYVFKKVAVVSSASVSIASNKWRSKGVDLIGFDGHETVPAECIRSRYLLYWF